MGQKSTILINGVPVDFQQGDTPEDALGRAGIPTSRALVAVGRTAGGDRIIPRGQPIPSNLEEFVDVPVFRYGA